MVIHTHLILKKCVRVWMQYSDGYMENLTQYVLIRKTTGDLFVGTKICILGDNSKIELQDKRFTIAFLTHDGWIIEHPETQVPIFLNLRGEQFFEVLGEL